MIATANTVNDTIQDAGIMSVEDLLLLNAQRFTQLAEFIDQYRPRPPTEICSIIQKLNPRNRSDFIVDLGCGSGLSMEPWLDRAKIMVGVDPNGEMLGRAEARINRYRGSTVVGLRHAYSDTTGVDARAADVVTASQSFHWMEPGRTFEEVNRILKSGGIFAVYDFDWPPSSTWEVAFAWKELLANVEIAEQKIGDEGLIQHWSKEECLNLIDESGLFRFSTDTVIAHTESADADRHLGLALSLPRIQNLFLHGVREKDLGMFDFFRTIETILKKKKGEITFNYRVRLAVK